MPAPSQSSQSDPSGRLLAAIEAGDADLASRLLTQADADDAAAFSPDVRKAAATLFIRRERWTDAIDLLASLEDPDLPTKLQLTLARNLALMQSHRPSVHDDILHSPVTAQCQIIKAERGSLTIVRAAAGAEPQLVIAGPDPEADLARAARLVPTSLELRDALMLSTISDGRLLNWIARYSPRSSLGMDTPVFLIEPCAQLTLHTLMLNDYTGSDGPIEQQRFFWLIGPQWNDRFAALLRQKPGLLLRSRKASSIPGDEAVWNEANAIIREALDRRDQRASVVNSRIQSYYNNLSSQELADVFGSNPPRTPRALILASRFTSVLQHSARDVLDALRSLGWSARLLIEDSDHDRMTLDAMRTAVDEDRPDLVFIIDTLRSDLQGVFPPQLPCICWIQDDMPRLTSKEAGESVTKRDFILTAASPVYVDRYNYPKRQCIDLIKLTRSPDHPPTWAADGDDIVYVSNASNLPERMTEQLAEFAHDAGAGDEGERLVRDSCQRLVNIYQRGASLAGHKQIAAVVASAEQDLDWQWQDDHTKAQLIQRLIHPFNDALYRQQALAWAADAAHDLKLSLSIYGVGWEKHPRFAPFARGPVEYGPALEDLTRRSKINLQIVPYSCMHQRLLDGLVAGGFFLIRTYPGDIILREIASFLRDRLDPSIETTDQALRRLSAADRRKFERVMRKRLAIDDACGVDQVARFRDLHRRGFGCVYETLPALDEVTYTNAAELRARLMRFVSDEDARRSVSEQQRRFVEERYTYEAGLRRVLGAIRELISTEDAETPTPHKAPTEAVA